ncbi:hypothetical protein Bca101_062888 [Brassica carinata]
MWRFSLAISFFLFVSTIVRATDVKYCDGKEEYEVKVQRIDISSYPIVRGEPATFSISVNTDNVISRGKLVIESHDLCDEIKCPVAIGDFLVTHSQMLAGYIPHGSYSLKMKVDGHKKELTCIKFSYNIGFGSSLAVDI